MQDNFETVIITVATAISMGVDLEQIHDALVDKGWSEDDIFLFVKAAELLVQNRYNT